MTLMVIVIGLILAQLCALAVLGLAVLGVRWGPRLQGDSPYIGARCTGGPGAGMARWMLGGMNDAWMDGGRE